MNGVIFASSPTDTFDTQKSQDTLMESSVESATVKRQLNIADSKKQSICLKVFNGFEKLHKVKQQFPHKKAPSPK